MAPPEDLKSRSERFASGPRLTEIDRLAGLLEASLPAVPEGVFGALAMIVDDAGLDSDERALALVLDRLPRLAALAGRDLTREAALVEGRLLGLIDVAQHAMQRALPTDFLGHLEPDGHSHRFLQQVAADSTLTNTAIARALDVDETEASRVGRRLIVAGFARSRKLGRRNQWSITPKGRQALQLLEAGGVERPLREHPELAGGV